jgi:hypothetical protein
MTVTDRMRQQTTPRRQVVRLDGDLVLRVKERAMQQSMERDYRGRGDTWGRGLCDDRPGMPREAVGPFVGLLGEAALVEWLNGQFGRRVVELDLEPRANGDGGCDVLAMGVPIQVKTRTGDYGVSLVRRYRGDGTAEQPRSRIHVFAQVERLHEHQPVLLGWSWTDDVFRLPVVPARRGDHMNSEVGDHLLSDMLLLPAELIMSGDQ